MTMNSAQGRLVDIARACGADDAATLPVAEIVFRPEFRAECEKNVCGHYGKCWMCPPDVGEIHLLVDKARQFEQACVYCTVAKMEKTFDLAGLERAVKRHYEVTRAFAEAAAGQVPRHYLLGAGNCPVCGRCAIVKGEPCYFPELAHPSLESHGIAVNELAKSCGLAYNNGAGTVTLFGALLYDL